MKFSSSNSSNDTCYFIIDSDNLLFEYRTVLVNFLGTISNAIENKLNSPWNYNSKHLNSKEISNGIHLNGSNSKTSENTLSLRSHSLKVAIESLLKLEVVPSELIKKCLSTLNSVLSLYNIEENANLESFLQTFSGSTLLYIFVENGQILKQKYSSLEDLSPSKILNFISEILLLGWHRGCFLEILNGKTPKNHPEYFISNLDGKFNFNNPKFIFVTSFPEATKTLLTINGFLAEINENFIIIPNFESLDIENLEKAVKCFRILTNNSRFIDLVSDHFFSNFGNFGKLLTKYIPSSSETSATKVDLLSSINPKDLSGVIGSYLEFEKPLIFSGEVFKGFGRGFSLLGIYTANLRCNTLPYLLTGVYIGTAFIQGNSEVSSDYEMDTIVSIGFNPHFFGTNYSIEAYLYHTFEFPLLGQIIQLNIKGYLRPDSKYKSIEILVDTIQSDLHLHKLISSISSRNKHENFNGVKNMNH